MIWSRWSVPTRCSRLGVEHDGKTSVDVLKMNKNILGGGFKYFLFSSLTLGKWSKLTSIFFKWVPPTSNIYEMNKQKQPKQDKHHNASRGKLDANYIRIPYFSSQVGWDEWWVSFSKKRELRLDASKVQEAHFFVLTMVASRAEVRDGSVSIWRKKDSSFFLKRGKRGWKCSVCISKNHRTIRMFKLAGTEICGFLMFVPGNSSRWFLCGFNVKYSPEN